jgi:hypothetical protein
MINETEKSIWCRFCETALAALRKPAAPRLELPALDPERNDLVLAQARADDPLWQVFLSYCQTHMENNLRSAFNPALTLEQQVDFKNRAGAVAALVEDIETSRQRLREEQQARQKRDQSKGKK